MRTYGQEKRAWAQRRGGQVTVRRELEKMGAWLLITKVPKVTILKARVKEKMKNTLDIPVSVLGDAVHVW